MAVQVQNASPDTPLTGPHNPRSSDLRVLCGAFAAWALVAPAMVGCGSDAPDPASTASLPELPDPVRPSEAPRGEPEDSRWITIALVGEVRGEVEPCGCPTLPYGGFVRRERALDGLRAEAGTGPLFHLDAGELLVKGFATSSRDRPRGPRRHRARPVRRGGRGRLVAGSLGPAGVGSTTAGARHRSLPHQRHLARCSRRAAARRLARRRARRRPAGRARALFSPDGPGARPGARGPGSGRGGRAGHVEEARRSRPGRGPGQPLR